MRRDDKNTPIRRQTIDQSAAIDVITWVASPIKFYADMGLLLAFMFLCNMRGVLVLSPARAHFLLKPSALQSSADAKASVQLGGETA